jgi:hypothetical protein
VNPVNSSENKGCGNPTTTECVFWQGDNIECLGIERGQKISLSVKKVADKVCELQDALDLSDLDLKCIFDLCLSCPQPEKTLFNVLTLLINKVCTLAEAIEDLGSTDPEQATLVRLASCFQYTNTEGDTVFELPHEDYTKRIANEVCSILLKLSSLEDDIQELQDDVSELTERVTTLENATGDEILSCLSSDPLPVSDALQLLDTAFCQLRGYVGLSTAANQAIAQQQSLDDLNTEFSATPGFKINPANLSESIRNLWVVLDSLRDAVKTIQSTCCAFDCDDVKVGFVVAFEDGLEVVRLRFTSGSGTNIPSGFTDIGSVITITDESGNSLSFNITIENNGEEVLNLLGLNANEKLTFVIETKLSNGSITCSKCITKTIDAATACEYCEITSTGTGTITIVYEETLNN